MKTLFALLFLFVFSFSSFSQESTVPVNVKNSFSQKYPGIKEVKWEKEGKDKFEAGFTQNGIKTSVVLDEEGEIEETETQIQLNELPSGVLSYVKTNYKDFIISETAKIVKANNEELFEAEITKGNKKQDLLFDKSGNPVQKKSDSDDEENVEEDGD